MAEPAMDPAVGLRFEVKIDEIDIGSFTGCEGLAAQFDVFEYQEGGQNAFVHRLPGRLKYPNIKLTRPVDQNSGSLAAWFSSSQQSVKRHTASIAAFDARGTEIARWNLVGLYPASWTGPAFSSDGNGVAKETLELAHNGFLG